MTEIIRIESTSLVAPSLDDMLIADFIDSRRSPRTRRSYSASIAMLRAFLGKPLGEWVKRDALDYHQYLKGRFPSLASIKLHIDIAKALFDYGLDINVLRTNVMRQIKTDVPPQVTHKRILTEEEIMRLIEAPKRQRDKLMLRLMYAAGLRVSEVCGLVWGDLLPNGVLHIRNGKGQKERWVTLSAGMIDKLAAFRGDATVSAPMFKSQKGGGHIDESGVHRVVKTAAALAGISGDASAHWLRHSHASHALDRGASLVTVRDTLGHQSIATTNKYLHSKRQDSSALHLAV